MYFNQLYGSNTRLFEGNLFWLGQHYPPILHIGRKNNPTLILLTAILKQPSKIIPSKKTANINL